MSATIGVGASPALPAEVDVVVVGSGAAALTGAYTAAANGLNVLVLEKTPYVGGTCAYAGAALWLPGNHILARDGVEDSTEAGLAYLQATVGDRTPRELQEAFVRTSPELVDFLEQTGGLEFDFLPFPDYFEAPGRSKPAGRSIRARPIEGKDLGPALTRLRPTAGADKFGIDEPRDILTGGQSLIGRLLLALEKTEHADIRTECPMISLLTAEGAVIGVVTADGHEVRSRHGVLVGAGGYDSNPVLRKDLHGLPTAAWTCGPTGANTGDALVAMKEAGASFDLLDEAWWCPGVLYPNGLGAFLPIVRGGVFVDPEGRRFTNETAPYDQSGHDMLAKLKQFGPESEFWWVFDSRRESAPGVGVPDLDLSQFVGTPYLKSAASIEALAEHIGVPADALCDTISRWNCGAADGTDPEFNRGVDDYDLHMAQGDGPNPALVPIVHAPFRAVRVVLSDLGTKGGARTGASAQVLNTDGEPISGLYAVGNSAASVAGNVYPGPGTPIGSGMVFAYRAVQAMLDAKAETEHLATTAGL